LLHFPKTSVIHALLLESEDIYVYFCLFVLILVLVGMYWKGDRRRLKENLMLSVTAVE
jgi:hypothetical protein